MRRKIESAAGLPQRDDPYDGSRSKHGNGKEEGKQGRLKREGRWYCVYYTVTVSNLAGAGSIVLEEGAGMGWTRARGWARARGRTRQGSLFPQRLGGTSVRAE